MWRYFFLGAAVMMLSVLSSCSNDSDAAITLPLAAGPLEEPVEVAVPVPVPMSFLDTLYFVIQSTPDQPQNELYLGDWRYRAYNIDDQARPKGPSFYGQANIDGSGAITLPEAMFTMPLVIHVYNEISAAWGEDKECINFDIFVPSECYNQTIWSIDPLSTAVWQYYFQAAIHRGNAWGPSQVDCFTWLESLEALSVNTIITNEIRDQARGAISVFRPEVLIDAWQENQELLVPTRPPICLATRRHLGGSMARGNFIPLSAFPWVIDDSVPAYLIPGPPIDLGTNPDFDPIVIGKNGIVENICGVKLAGDEPSFISVNSNEFFPTSQYFLSSLDFNGTIHDQIGIVPNIDISFYNIRLGNGRTLNDFQYDDTCSISEVVRFTNTESEDQELLGRTGVTFSDLFGPGLKNNTVVWKTSDGDAVIDNTDRWVIFHALGTSTGIIPAPAGHERVITVELLGNSRGDYKDDLHMTQPDPESIFIGLESNYLMGSETIDGELAFLSYTVTTWSGEDEESREEMRRNIADCYEASDVWTRNFFVTRAFQLHKCEDYLDECCDVEKLITPLLAAEMAVRSQCFSNSRSNNKWQNSDFGFWSINSSFGSHSNVVINPGWLGPDLDIEIYVQRFDEAIFSGPRVVTRTDYVGQLMAVVPTLAEGDRILLRSSHNCCSDYDLTVPCVPEFTEFITRPNMPYVRPPLGL